MANPQKQKGSSFEREIANFLSKTYGESFIRAPGSGAYVGGKNQSRKQFLHEGQVRSFKGDIVPGQNFPKLNVECKSYKEFPFHLALTGNCKQLEVWLDQLLEVSDKEDLNVLFIKINRKGRFVCVQSKLTWITDQFLYYTSIDKGDWLIIEFEHFWAHNINLFKAYSGSSDTKSISNINSEDILHKIII